MKPITLIAGKFVWDSESSTYVDEVKTVTHVEDIAQVNASIDALGLKSYDFVRIECGGHRWELVI